AGILTPEEAEHDERKNVITRALGAEPAVEPDFFQVDILEDDVILMCTDGLYDELSEEEIIDVLEEHMTMSATSAELVLRANLNGGHDNITVVSLRVMEEDING
ncbi:MAG: SpoIIE family protein phosphatase, partial [Firmicutes bacterium]|nr:SpoIIE family protein phosphatase [Bacillota bacterium]